MGLNAYGQPGIPGIGTGGASGLNDPLLAMGMARAAAQSRGDSSPSVMDGGSDPLSKAYAYANSEEGQKETAEKHGVTPPGGGAGEAEDAEAPAEPEEERGPLDALWEWVTGEREFGGSIPESASPSHDFSDVDLEGLNKTGKSTQAEQGAAAGVSNLETSMGQALGSKKGGPGVKDQAPDGEQGGPPSEEEIVFRTYLRQVTNYHGSPGHNEGDSTPTDEPTDVGGGTVSITASRDQGRAMFGQPNQEASRGGGGRGLPTQLGDDGTIDPGEENDTGGWTSNSRTEEPADALEGFGGSGLTLADARRDDDEEEDDEDEDSAS
jgi:hypothetical protein